ERLSNSRICGSLIVIAQLRARLPTCAMDKYPGSVIQCFTSLLALWHLHMDDLKTIVLQPAKLEKGLKPLKILDTEPLRKLADHELCPQLMGLRLEGSCFHFIVDKDTLGPLSPIINPFLQSSTNIVRFCYPTVIYTNNPTVGTVTT
ncbi:MAG: hypothetical protein QOH50_5195, partial [Kribbellaceae bacterium]|nr:hypothetical protein [Kribbellaceae bacterium]